jgi:S1-C subfamily serine protease
MSTSYDPPASPESPEPSPSSPPSSSVPSSAAPRPEPAGSADPRGYGYGRGAAGPAPGPDTDPGQTARYPTAYPAQGSYPGAGDPGPAGYPGYPYPGHPGQAYPGQTYPGHTGSGHAGHPGHPGQAGAPDQGGYPGQGSYQGQGGYPGQYGYPGQSGYPGQPGYGGYPAGQGTLPPGYGAYPGGYGPAGPGGPGDSGHPSGSDGRARRTRRVLIATGVAVVVGAASFLGVQATGASSVSKAMTTAQITHDVSPGLVDVVSQLGYEHAESAGTGLVLTSSGEILTNNHVIEGATAIKVTDIGNGKTYTAKVVGYDASHDIAVLQLQGASGLDTVTLGDSSSAAVGSKVVALGNAEGKGGAPSVVAGKITSLGASITASDEGSGTSEKLTGLIHHDASIQPGDSGGPLVNTAGQVIGIDTAASSGFQFQSSQSKTQAFAIPINQAVKIADQIEAGHASATVHIGATAFLGVQVLSAQDAQSNGVPAGQGADLAGTVSGGPAGKAGLGQGDVITSLGGRQVTSPASLQAAVAQYHPGDKVKVSWTTAQGKSQSATIVAISGPAG